MTDLYYEKQDNLEGINTATGDKLLPERNGANKGVTVPIGTVVFMLKPSAKRRSVHLKWDNALAGAITFEACDYPVKAPDGTADVADHSVVVGDWLPYNPAHAGPLYGSVVGVGHGIANCTITVVAGNAGGGRVTLPDLPGRRWRVKIVATAGGILRVGEALAN